MHGAGTMLLVLEPWNKKAGMLGVVDGVSQPQMRALSPSRQTSDSRLLQEQQCYSANHGNIREIEGRPMPSPDVEIEKVRNAAEMDAVNNIS